MEALEAAASGCCTSSLEAPLASPLASFSAPRCVLTGKPSERGVIGAQQANCHIGHTYIHTDINTNGRTKKFVEGASRL